MLARKKTGSPDPKYYDTNEVVAKFDSVRQWLLKNCKKVCQFHIMDSGIF